MPTLGDSFRLYVKPSLDGLLVIRKRNTARYSARVKAINDRVSANPPAAGASSACVAAGNSHKGIKYKGGQRQLVDVANIKCFKSQLRKAMRSVVGVGITVPA